jgi:hypothetical protein
MLSFWLGLPVAYQLPRLRDWGRTPTTKLGWKGWHLMSQFQAIVTTEPARTMPMPT